MTITDFHKSLDEDRLPHHLKRSRVALLERKMENISFLPSRPEATQFELGTLLFKATIWEEKNHKFRLKQNHWNEREEQICQVILETMVQGPLKWQKWMSSEELEPKPLGRSQGEGRGGKRKREEEEKAVTCPPYCLSGHKTEVETMPPKEARHRLSPWETHKAKQTWRRCSHRRFSTHEIGVGLVLVWRRRRVERGDIIGESTRG